MMTNNTALSLTWAESYLRADGIGTECGSCCERSGGARWSRPTAGPVEPVEIQEQAAEPCRVPSTFFSRRNDQDAHDQDAIPQHWKRSLSA
jgi:hypothetical protein